jgi:hypothetical protein
MKAAPQLTARYRVEKNDTAPVAALSARLLGYLDRMRQSKPF